MIRRFAPLLMAASLFLSACTAIVLGQLSDTADLPVDAGSTTSSSGASGTSGTAVRDKCDLLGSGDEPNRCSDCIKTSCGSHVEYACDRAAGEYTTKPWFSSLKSCAQNPYRGISGVRYMCSSYDEPEKMPLTGNDENAKEREAELCVRDQCLNGDTPACKLCLVTIEKTGSAGGEAKLEDSTCGKCLRSKCEPVIVRCCTKSVMYIARNCGYTSDPEKKKECLRLNTAPDGGKPPAGANDDDVCEWDMSACYQANCRADCASSE